MSETSTGRADTDAAHARLEHLLNSDETHHVEYELMTIEVFLLMNAVSREGRRYAMEGNDLPAKLLSDIGYETVKQVPEIHENMETLIAATESSNETMDIPWYIRLVSGIPWAIFLVLAALVNLYFVSTSALPSEWWLAVGNAFVVGLLGFSLGRYVEHPEAWDV